MVFFTKYKFLFLFSYQNPDFHIILYNKNKRLPNIKKLAHLLL